ncbi:MAG: hypothetical protein JW720_12575 [Sedimentisphaerales bacterium]|nr:hypothetical protein [Sedimentisphaerales bacterium]
MSAIRKGTLIGAVLSACLLASSVGLCASAGRTAGRDLPKEWSSDWNSPPAELRPLQIVHGLPASETGPEAMTKIKNLGLGGIVCNVAFNDYLKSEQNWRTLIKAVESCRDAGLIVWIYDEDGYPSGAAGGVVLEKNPKFEALALAYDASAPAPFTVRRSYEHTHASNNYYAARRYPNLIDAEAVDCFVQVTHEAYRQRLQEHFGKTIKAFFTDEPSFMAVNIGQLDEAVRKNVRVADAPDENIKPLPSVPWVADLPAKYRQRYGEELLKVRSSLFSGEAASDRKVRTQFWELLTDLFAERYYGKIGAWCRGHNVASSGHILWEEQLVQSVPLEGNPLKMLMAMSIPGLDMLTSDPEAAIHTGWLTASLPGSAALFNGGRRVMTEVSDFSQTMAKQGAASVEQMCTTAAWQAAFGVTEFALYYNRAARPPEDYRAYCDFVGRLNSVLRDAAMRPRVVLYYPIRDIWGEYKPVASRLSLDSQSERAKTIVNSFMSSGQRLTRRQISFALADHELLGSADILDSQLVIKGRRFDSIVVPAGVELPDAAAVRIERFKAAGGQVLTHNDLNNLDSGLRGAGESIVAGRFIRNGREIMLIVNVGDKACNMKVPANKASEWLLANPATGEITTTQANRAEETGISISPRSAVVLVGPMEK